MHRAPMCTPFVCFRITAYHMVMASLVPLILNHGGGGPSIGWLSPASSSWRPVAI